MAAAQALGQIRGSVPAYAVRDSLCGLLEDPDGYVRMAAVQATTLVGQLGEMDLIDRLVALLFDPEQRVQMAAAQAIDSMRDKGVVARLLETLVQRLEANGWKITEATALALGSAARTCPPPRVLVHIEEMLLNGSDTILTTVMGMGRSAATSPIISRLTAMLDDSNSLRIPQVMRSLMLDGVRIFRGATFSNIAELSHVDPS